MGRLWVGSLCLAMGAVFVAGGVGCALGDRNIALRYAPIVEAKASGQPAAAIVKFEDDKKKVEVGEVRNAYGMIMAKVYAKDQDIGAWAANALAAELEKAGVKGTKYQDAAPPDATVAITGTVTEAYIKMYMSSRASVKMSVVVTKARVPVLNKEYTGKGAVLALLASTGEYENVMLLAMQDLMKKLVPDVIKAIE